jgi:hypothetical protein
MPSTRRSPYLRYKKRSCRKSKSLYRSPYRKYMNPAAGAPRKSVYEVIEQGGMIGTKRMGINRYYYEIAEMDNGLLGWRLCEGQCVSSPLELEVNKDARPPNYRLPYRSPKRSIYGSPRRSPYGSPYTSPQRSPQQSPYGSPQRSPQQSPYTSPYGSPYTSPRRSPYRSSRRDRTSKRARTLANPEAGAPNISVYQVIEEQGGMIGTKRMGINGYYYEIAELGNNQLGWKLCNGQCVTSPLDLEVNRSARPSHYRPQYRSPQRSPKKPAYRRPQQSPYTSPQRSPYGQAYKRSPYRKSPYKPAYRRPQSTNLSPQRSPYGQAYRRPQSANRSPQRPAYRRPQSVNRSPYGQSYRRPQSANRSPQQSPQRPQQPRFNPRPQRPQQGLPLVPIPPQKPQQRPQQGLPVPNTIPSPTSNTTQLPAYSPGPPPYTTIDGNPTHP